MEFAEFFHEVHGYPPFPWQSRLAEQLAQTGRWPAVIDLPTASGKTAVIDIAVWHLATQAQLPPEQRTAPRRIWFVVDRRIVVDEAYRRAEKIAGWLGANSDSGVAKALYEVSGFEKPRDEVPPLSIGRLRGGILQDTGWASFPSQPAVLTSTVDQFGSRLLFRGYGMGSGMWPVHAALAGNDSLLVLDEAHLAEPLIQTLNAFHRYRGGDWAEQPVHLPWQMTQMSATPPPGECDRFPKDDAQRRRALDHPLLDKRRNATKWATLEQVNEPKASKKRPYDACAKQARAWAERFVESGRQRVAVMMNRVDAAVTVHEALSEHDGLDAVLLTGRMRPYDRDQLLETYKPYLASNSQAQPSKPIVLVTTQCLEVGADFSFDAMVTECASLDALRQRFGRLDRLGEIGQTQAAILAWHGDVPDEDKLDDADPHDPIYGNALARTWHWLQTQAEGEQIDMGIAGLDAKLQGADIGPLLPPRPAAPVLLPAYLDAWCQTGPQPYHEAEPALFLHGKQDEQAQVQVAFRRDLTDNLDDRQWADSVRLMPPVSGELLTVRLSRLQRWLAGEKLSDESDIEGVGGDSQIKASTDDLPSRWVRYRGPGDQTLALGDHDQIKPGDVLVLPAGDRIPRALGHGQAPGRVDVLEPALANSGRPQVLRLSRALVKDWAAGRDDVDLDLVLNWLDSDEGTSPDLAEWGEVSAALDIIIPEICREALSRLASPTRIVPAPAGEGWVVFGKRDANKTQELDPFADAGDGLSLIGQSVSLAAHAQQVAELTRWSARVCVPKYADQLEHAAARHDDGKQDPRFQALLHNQLCPYHGHDLLAKSDRYDTHRDRILRHQLNLQGFRHEMLSMQRVQAEHPDADDLLLHLIASHHGHARPLAPVFMDAVWTDPPPHHLGSGVVERFWKLTRRHGWWGLAYLEAILRLADHHASRFPRDVQSEAKRDA